MSPADFLHPDRPAEGAAGPRPERPADGPGAPRPSDLGTGEHDVASWLGGLDRREPPADLGDRMVESWTPPAVRRVGRGRAMTATVTVALLVFAVAVLFSLVARDAGVAHNAPSPYVPPPTNVVDDPDVHLYRDLETFRNLDLVGPDDGDLVAGENGR